MPPTEKIIHNYHDVTVEFQNGNGNGMGMGMKSLKWEGIGTNNLVPHISSVRVCVTVKLAKMRIIQLLPQNSTVMVSGVLMPKVLVKFQWVTSKWVLNSCRVCENRQLSTNNWIYNSKIALDRGTVLLKANRKS